MHEQSIDSAFRLVNGGRKRLGLSVRKSWQLSILGTFL
jgi:hypothetical protein